MYPSQGSKIMHFQKIKPKQDKSQIAIKKLLINSLVKSDDRNNK